MKKTIVILCLMLIFSGCSVVNPSNAEDATATPAPEDTGYIGEIPEDMQIENVPEQFTLGNNNFSFDAAALLYEEDKNLALSPASLELALLMAHAGAVDETARQMLEALSMSGLGNEKIISACSQLMARANIDGMEAADSIWMDTGYQFSQDYIDTCTGPFMSDAYTVDIDSNNALEQINGWVNDKTHGRIEKIKDEPFSADTMMVLINAIYFLGEWTVPFDGNDTGEEGFAAPSGEVQVQMMNGTREVPYYSGDSFDMISLDFKTELADGGFAMAFILPKDDAGLKELINSMDGESFATALDGMQNQNVDIKLPKFEYMFKKSFVDTLKGLGMVKAFDADAQFDNMTGSSNDLFIAEVLHKCYIRIDELGAEAAAVTEVEMRLTAAMPEENPEFYADRPFLFAIYSKADGTIYFMGAVNNPLSQE